MEITSGAIPTFVLDILIGGCFGFVGALIVLLGWKGLRGYYQTKYVLPPKSGFYKVRDSKWHTNVVWFDAAQKKFLSNCSDYALTGFVGWKFLRSEEKSLPAPVMEHRVCLLDLSFALLKSWSATTSAFSDWDPSKPSYGQCAVTALIVQDFYQGKILRCPLVSGGNHYWNQLPDGNQIDLTFEQFAGGRLQKKEGPTEEVAREYILSNPKTVTRYTELKLAVLKALSLSIRNTSPQEGPKSGEPPASVCVCRKPGSQKPCCGK
jgi:hypothetical protein